MALVVAQFARAQTVDEVINKYVEALGGKEKLATLKTLRMDGSMSLQGTDVSITNTRSHMVGSRTDIVVMGTQNYQIVTPDKGWVFMPVQGQSAPEEMGADVFKYSHSQLDLQGPLVDYATKGNKVELEGKETIDGSETFKLKLTNKVGGVATYFIDAKTYRINKVSTKMTMGGEEIESVTSLSNYKQNADGFWFAYTNTSVQGETYYDKIETNIKVDESIFKAN